jgi:hypothetical protein
VSKMDFGLTASKSTQYIFTVLCFALVSPIGIVFDTIMCYQSFVSWACVLKLASASCMVLMALSKSQLSKSQYRLPTTTRPIDQYDIAIVSSISHS